MQYILAHDIGTTGDKATLFSTEGAIINSVVVSYPVHYGENNRAEQDPEDWFRAVCVSTKRLLENIDPAQILSVGFSGHMMGCVLLGKDRKLLRNAIIWADQRAVEECGRIAEAIGNDRFYEITGGQNNATNSVAKLLWCMTKEDLKDRIGVMLNCKDYLVYRLTDRIGTDYSDASGTGLFDLNTFAWSEEIMDTMQIPASFLPEIFPAASVVGKVTDRAAAETGLLSGTPVVAGVGDGTAASVGSGISRTGEGYICLGTSAWISYMDDSALFDAKKRTFNLAGIRKGQVFPLGTMQSACASYNWMRDNIWKEDGENGSALYDRINQTIRAVPAGSNGVLFLPYLMGERSPWWDADAAGAFLGLRQMNTRADMMRAVMEGVALNLRLILDALRQKAPLTTLRIIGGGAKEPTWREVIADVLQVRIEKMNLMEEGCSLGAAVVAGIGAGIFGDESSIGRFLSVEETTEPDPALAETYHSLAGRFERTYWGLKDI